MSLASPEDVWDAKLEDASLRLAEDATAEKLAEAFGGDREYIDELCSEAVTVAIGEGDNVVTMDYFERAAERVGSQPENDDAGDKRVAVHKEVDSIGQVVASTTETEEGTVEDTTEPAPEESETTESVPDDVAQQLEDLTARVEELEQQNSELRQFLVKDLALVKGTLRPLVGADEGDDLEAFPDHARDAASNGGDEQ